MKTSKVGVMYQVVRTYGSTNRVSDDTGRPIQIESTCRGRRGKSSPSTTFLVRGVRVRSYAARLQQRQDEYNNLSWSNPLVRDVGETIDSRNYRVMQSRRRTRLLNSIPLVASNRYVHGSTSPCTVLATTGILVHDGAIVPSVQDDTTNVVKGKAAGRHAADATHRTETAVEVIVATTIRTAEDGRQIEMGARANPEIATGDVEDPAAQRKTVMAEQGDDDHLVTVTG